MSFSTLDTSPAARGGSAAAAPMASSSSSGGAGRPVLGACVRPSAPGLLLLLPFYSRGCDLNLYLSVSSLQTPPRSRHRLPCPAGREEGAEAEAGGEEAGGGRGAAAAEHRSLRAGARRPPAAGAGAVPGRPAASCLAFLFLSLVDRFFNWSGE